MKNIYLAPGKKMTL